MGEIVFNPWVLLPFNIMGIVVGIYYLAHKYPHKTCVYYALGLISLVSGIIGTTIGIVRIMSW